jgi:hypothetical protein
VDRVAAAGQPPLDAIMKDGREYHPSAGRRSPAAQLGAPKRPHTNRHGERCSQACGEGRHAECTETLETCNCTYRGLHKIMRRYATVPVARGAQTAEQFEKWFNGKYYTRDPIAKATIFAAWNAGAESALALLRRAK